MKKIVSTLLSLVMCLSLCACGGSSTSTPVEQEGKSSETVQDVPLSEAEYTAAISGLDYYVLLIMDETTALMSIINNHAEEIGSAPKTNLSKFDGFDARQAAIVEAYEVIKAYNTTRFSSELIACFHELEDYYLQIITCIEKFAQENSYDELFSIANELGGIHEEEIGEIGSLLEKAEQDFYGTNSSSTTTFTNKYGTPTTVCVHSGCNQYIASSGDTNCCTTHSNRCLNCNCYIDEDAMYCMYCISDAIKR